MSKKKVKKRRDYAYLFDFRRYEDQDPIPKPYKELGYDMNEGFIFSPPPTTSIRFISIKKPHSVKSWASLFDNGGRSQTATYFDGKF